MIWVHFLAVLLAVHWTEVRHPQPMTKPFQELVQKNFDGVNQTVTYTDVNKGQCLLQSIDSLSLIYDIFLLGGYILSMDGKCTCLSNRSQFQNIKIL